MNFLSFFARKILGVIYGKEGEAMDLRQNIRQEGRLIISPAMEQAFHVLAMPTLELTDWLEKEVGQNPLLEMRNRPPCEFNTSLIKDEPTLYEYLLGEIPLHFETAEEKEKAELIAGSLDRNGFLALSDDELEGFEEVLKRFHQIEPLGLGARNAQEALLIQLSGKEKNSAYKIIKEHYEDLLHKRWPIIAKSLKLSIEEVKELVIKELRSLNPFPGRQFQQEINPFLAADITIQKEEGRWNVEANLPSLQLFSPKEEMKHYLTEAKWLVHTLDQRKKTLEKIALYLLKEQQDYFEGMTDTPKPMTMCSLAKALGLSESTVTRAISHKAIATPRGLLKLRDFFSPNQDVKQLLLKLIAKEKEPLSDEALSQELRAQGIRCARRTVAKYRKELKIGSASYRKRSL